MPLIETRGAGSAQGFGEFAQSGPVNYIEDVFSTYLYTGNGSTQTITNGIDLSGKGGLVWLKNRTSAISHLLTSTITINGGLRSNSTAAQFVDSNFNFSYSATGFSQNNSFTDTNSSGDTFVSWTFRKQAKFFDVVTFTATRSGSGWSGGPVVVNHNLGSTPGCVIWKATSTTSNWYVHHRSLGNQYRMFLNTTDASVDTGITNYINPTSTNVTFSDATSGIVSDGTTVTIVVYLFAHDAGGFGLSGSNNVISCGSFVGNNSTPVSVTLGWETQWLLVRATNGNNWYMFDTMRGFVASPGTSSKALYPNLSDAEASWNLVVEPTATGFSFTTNNTSTWIYIAIRRGPMKVPTSGTSVYSGFARTGTGAAALDNTNFPVDLAIIRDRTNNSDDRNWFQDRLRGNDVAVSATNASAETTGLSATSIAFDNNTNLKISAPGVLDLWNKSGATYVDWLFRRAPGFFDIVCYTGTGSNTTQTHNLGVVPELIIVRRRATGGDWDTYSSALLNTEYLLVNGISAKATGTTRWNSTTPTSTVFSIGTSTTVNASGGTYVAYLFATLAGVSKVGSYTGTGTTKQIDCGFTGGARFVLIKRTDSTGDWYVYDSARGIVAGNDPYIFLNSTAAEVTNTDYVDTYSAGFELSSTAPAALNANGGSFIFFAVA